MDKNNEERVTNFKDLFFFCLHKWRIIVIISILSSVILTGFKIVKSNTNIDSMANQDDYNQQMEDYRMRKQTIENSILSIENTIRLQNEYLSEAPFMKVNAYAVPITTLKFSVSINESNNVNLLSSIFSTYKYLILTDTIEHMSQETGVKVAYLRQLIKIALQDEDTSFIQVNTGSDSVNEYTTFQIDIIGETEERMDELTDIFQDDFDSLKEKVTSIYGEHQISLIAIDTYEKVDTTYLDYQKNMRSYITELNNELKLRKNDLLSLSEPTTSSMKQRIPTFVYSILGLIVGAFVTVFIIMIASIFSDTVTSGKEIRNRLGKVKIIGEFTRTIARKKFQFVDNWIQTLERGSVILSDSDVFDIIIADIQYSGFNQNKLFLTGYASNEKLKDLSGQLQKSLPECTILVDSSLITSGATRRGLGTCDGVVLVEEKGVSKYSNIKKEVEIISDLQKDLLGIIVI